MKCLPDSIPTPHYLLQNRHEGGFTYLGLLILVAIIGITSAATIQVGAIQQRRMAEEELMAIGKEFRSALISYANATPPGQKRTPNSLKELLKDPRYPNPRRHLRKIHTDPLTGKAEWGIVELTQGSGIIGIHSLSNEKPIKIKNFTDGFQDLDDKASYREWKFVINAENIHNSSPTLTSPSR